MGKGDALNPGTGDENPPGERGFLLFPKIFKKVLESIFPPPFGFFKSYYAGGKPPEDVMAISPPDKKIRTPLLRIMMPNFFQLKEKGKPQFGEKGTKKFGEFKGVEF